MNEHTHYPGQGGGDAALRLSLRGLRQDRDPGHDLWPGIEARIRALPQVHAPASRQRSPWPLEMAASMLLAAAISDAEGFFVDRMPISPSELWELRRRNTQEGDA